MRRIVWELSYQKDIKTVVFEGLYADKQLATKAASKLKECLEFWIEMRYVRYTA